MLILCAVDIPSTTQTVERRKTPRANTFSGAAEGDRTTVSQEGKSIHCFLQLLPDSE